jgi:ABC-2 type transport system permease protein
MIRFVRAAWAIYRKDLSVWVHHPLIALGNLVPTLILLGVLAMVAAAVGRSPVALVTLDHGPQGREMQQIFHQAEVFRITDASPQEAQTLFEHLDVVAVITIPADFTRRVEVHASAPVEVTVDNLNLDFTNDIRRSIPAAITQFYATQGSANPIQVRMRENDLHTRDVDYIQYLVLPIIMFMLLSSGLITNGTATAGEWETHRIKELLLAPIARPTLIIGKVLAGLTTTWLMGVLALALGAALGWTRPEGSSLFTCLVIIALVALFSTGLGIALGAALQHSQPVTIVSSLGAFTLFFLAGGIGVLAFEPTWLQQVAALSPLTYGIHALGQAVFYNSSDQLGRDVLILSLSGLATLLLGILVMRRRIAS